MGYQNVELLYQPRVWCLRMYDLYKDIDVALAISLHAPNDELRNELVPINKKYPLDELIAAAKAYVA